MCMRRMAVLSSTGPSSTTSQLLMNSTGSCTSRRSSTCASENPAECCCVSTASRAAGAYGTSSCPPLKERSAPGGRPVPLRLHLRGACLEFGVSLEDEVADTVLRGDIDDRPQEREGSALAIHGVLPRGEGHGPAAAGSAFPRAEANELQTGEHAVGGVQFGIREPSSRGDH